MAIDYDYYVKATPLNKWFSGPELETLWNVSTTIRKARIKILVQKGLFRRRGVTANVQYRLLKTTRSDTSNNIVTPVIPTTLDELIAAATKLGTENEIMKKALLTAKAHIEKALESIT